jgi:hypothetical protein
MTSADNAVITAREALSRAEREQKEQERAENIKRLEGVRAELRTAKARYLELEHAIKTARENMARVREELKRLIERVSQSMDARPAVADILPGDPECVAWRKWHEALEAERDRVIARLHALPNPDTHVMEMVRLTDPAVGRIPYLENSEANLRRALDPKSGDYLKGGISRVG